MHPIKPCQKKKANKDRNHGSQKALYIQSIKIRTTYYKKYMKKQVLV